MDFNLQVLDEEEAKESVSEEEAKESISEDEPDPKVFCEAPSLVPYPGEAETLVKAGSSPWPVGALPSDSHGSEARTTEAACSSPSNI